MFAIRPAGVKQAHEHTGDIDRDPRNIETLQQTALSYEYLWCFGEQKSMFDLVLAIVPNAPFEVAGSVAVRSSS